MTMSSKDKQQSQPSSSSATNSVTTTTASNETMEWNSEEEIQLFFALEGLKPVGINKHFHMACIAERLSKSLNREIPAELIWKHLKTLYNLEVLDEMEPLPFPNEQSDFCLPDSEFSALITKKKLEIAAEEEKKQQQQQQQNSNNNNSNKRASSSSASSTSTSANGTAQIEINNKDKSSVMNGKQSTQQQQKDNNIDSKKSGTKFSQSDVPKRGAQKRTRGSMCLESPSSTPPPLPANKRRRI